MLTEAIEYPIEREDWLPTVLIGGGLWFAVVALGFVASIFLAFAMLIVTIPIGLFALVLSVVPYLLLMGFSVTVSRAIMDGRELPPTFEAWGQYARDGLYVLAISLIYGLPLLAVGVLAAVGIVTGAILGGDAGTMVMILTALVASLAGSVLGLVVLYFYPAALFNFARTGELGSVLDVDEMRRITLDTDYAVGWGLGAVAWVAGQMIGDALLFLIVGVFVYFYAQLVTTYLITRGGMDALGLEAPALKPAAAAALQPEPPDKPKADEVRTSPTGDTTPGPDRDAHPGTTPAAEPPAGTESRTEPVDESEVSTEPVDEFGDQPESGDFEPGTEEPATDEEPFEDERELEEVAGVGPSKAESLREAGFETIGDLRAASVDDLVEVDGIGPSLAERIEADIGGKLDD